MFGEFSPEYKIFLIFVEFVDYLRLYYYIETVTEHSVTILVKYGTEAQYSTDYS